MDEPKVEYTKAVKLAEDVWEAASHRAIEERVTLQELIDAALRKYLKLGNSER